MSLSLTSLRSIYKNAKITESQFQDSTYLSIPYQKKWFSLPLAQLSPSEIALLTELAEVPRELPSTLHHDWFLYLFGKQPKMPTTTEPLRILQFKVTFLDSSIDSGTYLAALLSMFTKTIDGFFVTANTGLIIEPLTKANYELSEFQGILQTIDADFITKTTLYLGQFWSPKEPVSQLFSEEQRIFNSSEGHAQQEMSIASLAMSYMTMPKRSESLILATLRERLNDFPEIKEVVLALYDAQGNISSAAKSLFLHRNTLQYRMEKFYEQTGFSLKKMDDLIFCYMLYL